MATDSNNKSRFSARGNRRVLEKRDRYRKLVIAVNIILVLILFPAAVWGNQALADGEALMPASAYYDDGGHGEYDAQLNGEVSSPERESAGAGQVPTGTAPATAGQVLTEAGQISTTTGQAPATGGQVENAVEAAGGQETPVVQGAGDSAVQVNKAVANQMELRRAGKVFMPDITILLMFASMIIILAGVIIVRTELEREKKRRRKRA